MFIVHATVVIVSLIFVSLSLLSKWLRNKRLEGKSEKLEQIFGNKDYSNNLMYHISYYAKQCAADRNCILAIGDVRTVKGLVELKGVDASAAYLRENPSEIRSDVFIVHTKVTESSAGSDVAAAETTESSKNAPAAAESADERIDDDMSHLDFLIDYNADPFFDQQRVSAIEDSYQEECKQYNEKGDFDKCELRRFFVKIRTAILDNEYAFVTHVFYDRGQKKYRPFRFYAEAIDNDHFVVAKTPFKQNTKPLEMSYVMTIAIKVAVLILFLTLWQIFISPLGFPTPVIPYVVYTVTVAYFMYNMVQESIDLASADEEAERFYSVDRTALSLGGFALALSFFVNAVQKGKSQNVVNRSNTLLAVTFLLALLTILDFNAKTSAFMYRLRYLMKNGVLTSLIAFIIITTTYVGTGVLRTAGMSTMP